MSFLFVKDRKKVCTERAKVSAEKKYNNLIEEKRLEYKATRNHKIMQEIIKLSREKRAFQNKAYKYHLDNYVLAEDSISDKTKEAAKRGSGLGDFTDYLSEELSKI